MKLIHMCIALSLAGMMAPTAEAAQQPTRPGVEKPRAQDPEPVTGEVLGVDDKTKTIVVKTAPDTEMKFAYSEETEIVGGEKGPQGLATSAGTIATVTYGVHGTTNVAIKIELKAKK